MNATICKTPDSYDLVCDMGDGDVELQVGEREHCGSEQPLINYIYKFKNTIFKTRKYLISKFTVLSRLLQEAESAGSLRSQVLPPLVTVKCDQQSVEDFKNTLQILYAS
jgi:hypothetical protein